LGRKQTIATEAEYHVQYTKAVRNVRIFRQSKQCDAVEQKPGLGITTKEQRNKESQVATIAYSITSSKIVGSQYH
jgi:hypothetical protein